MFLLPTGEHGKLCETVISYHDRDQITKLKKPYADSVVSVCWLKHAVSVVIYGDQRV